jgi:protein phosphatase PTC7
MNMFFCCTALFTFLCRSKHASAFVSSPTLKNIRPTSHLNDAPEPLGSEGDWTAYLDSQTTGLVYYFNSQSGESRWVPPTATFPSVEMDRSMKRQAEEKQKEYRFNQKQSSSNNNDANTKSKSNMFGTSVVEEKQQTSTNKQEQDDWFSFLAPTVEKNRVATKEQQPTTAQEVAVETLNEKKPSFFDKLLTKTRQREQQEQFVADVPTATTTEPTTIDAAPSTTTIVPVALGSCVMPAPSKIAWGGEDAVFCKGRTFGVFDGVSGADKLDGVPLYSKTMAKLCAGQIDKDQSLTIPEMTKLLTDVVVKCNKRATGATTAVLASIGPDGFLRALNIGDSGCVVIRDNKIVARTKEIQHFYECPYQFSEISPDSPRDGTKLNFELVAGDVLVAASDGVFDNLDDSSLIEVVASMPAAKPNQLAKKIADQARKVSLDPKAQTPYAKNAKVNKNPDYQDGVGGKVDDVSCVVGLYGS